MGLLDRNATPTREGSRSCVDGKGSLDLIHEAGLGHGDSIAVEELKGLKDFERFEGYEQNGEPFDFC
jgi:hypothetical protein